MPLAHLRFPISPLVYHSISLDNNNTTGSGAETGAEQENRQLGITNGSQLRRENIDCFCDFIDLLTFDQEAHIHFSVSTIVFRVRCQ